MALYFDSRAEKSVVDTVSSIGQALTGRWGLTGIGGIIGGMFGGPLGAVFGAGMGKKGGIYPFLYNSVHFLSFDSLNDRLEATRPFW